MWPLIRYQSVKYLGFIMPSVAVIAIVFSQALKGAPSTAALSSLCFLNFWGYFLTTGAVMHGEGYEEKYKGYRILGMLPVTRREIVTSRFLLLLGTVVLVTGCNMIVLLSTIPGSTFLIVIGGILWGIFCLLYGGGLMIGIFRFGYTRFAQFHWVLVLAAILLGFLFFGGIIEFPFSGESLSAFSRNPIGIIAAFAGAIGYFFLYRIALRVMMSGREE